MREVDARSFRDVCSHFATGVTVVTARNRAGNVRGMTASAFMFVSSEPQLVVVSVSERARLRATLDEATDYTVSLLAEDQQDVSDFFAGRSDALDTPPPFVEIDADAPPIIEGALAWIRCKVGAKHQAGDHILYVGEAMEIWADCSAPRLPLVFFKGDYVPIVPQEATPAEGKTEYLSLAGLP